MYRVWQALFSVLAVGCFLALEYLRDMDIRSIVFVVLSWVTLAAVWLLAVVWTVKKKYFRTLVLAALVAATRVSLEVTLSDFLKTAGWFLIGAVVLTMIAGWVIRMIRNRERKPAAVAPQMQAAAPGAPAAAPMAPVVPVAPPSAAPVAPPAQAPVPPGAAAIDPATAAAAAAAVTAQVADAAKAAEAAKPAKPADAKPADAGKDKKDASAEGGKK